MPYLLVAFCVTTGVVCGPPFMPVGGGLGGGVGGGVGGGAVPDAVHTNAMPLLRHVWPFASLPAIPSVAVFLLPFATVSCATNTGLPAFGPLAGFIQNTAPSDTLKPLVALQVLKLASRPTDDSNLLLS